jgi:hypothetical protein
MKKQGIIIIVIGLICLAACSFNKRHTTIVEKSNNHYHKIEYGGQVAFNDNGTSIKSISPDGYVEYQNDDKKLEAKNDGKGGISYELYQGYTRLNLDDHGREFIADAVKVMMQKGHYPSPSN